MRLLRLNPATFNAHLENMGEWFAWRKASACACINPNSGAPKAGCSHCDGKGYLWASPVRARAAIASSRIQQEWARMGTWDSGDMVVSIPESSPLYDVAQYDRVVVETNTDEFSLPLIRGAPNERVHGSIVKFTRVFWFDNNDQVVDGGLPTVANDGTLTWVANAPPPGKTYSLTGIKRQEFYCFGAFSVDRMKHAGARLPRRVVLRKFDLLGRSGSQ